MMKGIVLASAALAALAVTPAADAKVRHTKKMHAAAYSARPVLTVNRRSFLDPGPVVPVGSLSNYVTTNTVFGQTADQGFARSKFGNEALPRPLEVPGRPVPLVEFDTPAYRY